MAYSKEFSVSISSVIEREDGFKDYRFIAKTVIEKLGMEPVRNPEDVRTQYNFEQELREKSDFFVLIIGSVPSEMVEKELRIALSRGLSILVFVKVSYNKSGRLILPKNAKESLYKISPELYNMNIVTFEYCEDFAKKLEDELNLTLFRRVKLSPLIGLDPPVAYTEGIKLVRNAKYRVVLTQKSSILLLGPRIGNISEKEFYDELLCWLKQERDQESYFLHLFSMHETHKASKSKEYDLAQARKNLEEIMNLYKNNSKFFIKYAEDFDTTTHVIGDTGIGLNFKINPNRYYLFLPSFLTKDSELKTIISNVQRTGKPFINENIPDFYK